MIIGARKNLTQFLALNDGLSLVGPGCIYTKGLIRIRAEMTELGGKIEIAIHGYTIMGVVI